MWRGRVTGNKELTKHGLICASHHVTMFSPIKVLLFLLLCIWYPLFKYQQSLSFKMAAVSRPVNKAGFECEFVTKPPDCLQVECPVCLNILREPHQVTCCGKSFCNTVIKFPTNCCKAPCPCCKQVCYQAFPNKGLQQPLYEYLVYCVNKTDNGCDWTGGIRKPHKTSQSESSYTCGWTQWLWICCCKMLSVMFWTCCTKQTPSPQEWALSSTSFQL